MVIRLDVENEGSLLLTGRGSLSALTVFLCLLLFVFLPPMAKAQGESNAKFTQVKYQAIIPSGMPDSWTFVVHNTNCSENDEDTAHFFFEFYVDDSLSFDEYSSTAYRTWNCTRGKTVSNSYMVSGWSTMAPVNHDVRIELYWYHNGTSILEDTALFSVGVSVFMPLQDIYATSYFVLYLAACFLLLMYDYVLSLEE